MFVFQTEADSSKVKKKTINPNDPEYKAIYGKIQEARKRIITDARKEAGGGSAGQQAKRREISPPTEIAEFKPVVPEQQKKKVTR